MKAVRFHEYGDFDVLRVEEVEDPVPGAGELLLRVRAAGVNPIDWKIVHGWVSGGKPLAEPRGLGFDVAGIVEQVGPDVSGVAPGDELLGSPTSPSYAELALSRPGLLVRRPPGVPWNVAGGLGVVVGTAYATLARLAVEEGETLLVLGASGGVGSMATQLAAARGVRVIGTSSPSKLEQVRALGATPVAYGDALAERLREAAPEGVDAALDASGHGELAAAVALAGGPERVLTIASSADAAELGVEFHAGGGGEHMVSALEEVLPLIESGAISFPLAGAYDLGEVGDALRESEHGHPAGKLVVTPG
ncbi:MAG: NADPH:quinone reductase [Solirubrobacterales bacterium]|nr:NADPH:quinone reductase [Solirubrobacterales bacterium]